MSSPSFTIERIQARDVSDEMLTEAAELFSSAYGVWSPAAAEKTGKYCKRGQRVSLSAARLRGQSLPPGTDSVFVRALRGGVLVGHAFASRWMCGGRRVCWVTQLCVRPEFRRRAVATKILERVKDGQRDWAYGILSSHPAAVLAALRAFGRGVEDVDLDVVREHARGIMSAAPIEYVKTAKLKGTLFETGDSEDGRVCCADTSFWVDHAEPLVVLAAVKEKGVEWPFGALPEGCEFLVIVGAEAASD